MDELIAQYAAKLQEVYDKRTAGDHTFTGILADFAREAEPIMRDDYELANYNPWPEVD